MSRTPAAALLMASLLAGAPPSPVAADAAPQPAPAQRIVSMNPSLASILVALDAATTLVGVEEHARRLHPELSSVALIGGLFNPSLEGVIALEPDLVVLVPSAEQRDFRGRLEALGIEVLALPNTSVEEILGSIEELGLRVGRRAAARLRVAAIRRAFAEARAASADRTAPRSVVVLQRDPLYVVGAGSFIDEMLGDAGAVNVGRALSEPYPRAALEWLIDASPELILDASDDPTPAAAFWSRWPSIPAVANGRVVALPPEVTFPGPYIDRSLALLAERVRGESR
ncbi:MAG: ABC transporter substrate-binding protein [Myxococcota bacterium]